MKSITLISLVALGSFALYGNAYADNRHVYNGSYCDNYFGSQVGDFNHQRNGIRNTAASPRLVSCPILVDEVDNLGGTISVWVHYTGAFTANCALHSMNGTGAVLQTVVGASNGWFQMPNITVENLFSSYFLECTLPAGGVLNTIRVDENNGVNADR